MQPPNGVDSTLCANDRRRALTMWAFFMTWLVSFAHACWCRRAAWRPQARAISGAAVVCVLLNAVTTGDHPLRAASKGLWAEAGVDLMLLAAYAAKRMVIAPAGPCDRARKTMATAP